MWGGFGRFGAANSGDTLPMEQPKKDEDSSKGSSWIPSFSSLWSGKSKNDRDVKEDQAGSSTVGAQTVVDKQPTKDKKHHSKDTGDWVVTDASDYKRHRSHNVDDGQLEVLGDDDADDEDVNALDAALKQNNALHKKLSRNLKRTGELERQARIKDKEISRLKALLPDSIGEDDRSSLDPHTPTADMSPVETHRAINQPKLPTAEGQTQRDVGRLQQRRRQSQEQTLEDLETKLSKVEEENTNLRMKVAESEIQSKTASSVDTRIHDFGPIPENDQEIDGLKKKIAELREIAERYDQIKEHSKGQSQQVMELKLKLQASEMTKEDAESLQRVVDELDESNYHLRERLKTVAEQAEVLTNEKQQLLAEFQQLQSSMSRMGGLSATNADLRQKLSNLEDELACAQKERVNALSELETEKAKALTFKLDFEEERRDREKAHSIIGELEKKRSEESTRNAAVVLELENHKIALENVEGVKKAYEKKLREGTASLQNEVKRLREELNGKTSQVKQYAKQAEQLKAQLQQATKNIGRLSEEMDKLRKKVKKEPKGDKKNKTDSANLESDLSSEIEGLHTENKYLKEQLAELTSHLQFEKGSMEPHTPETPVFSPQDHRTNEQKVPSLGQQAKRAQENSEEIRQQLQEQFQQPTALPCPLGVETPAAGTGEWMGPPQRASLPVSASNDPNPPVQLQHPASAPNTVQQSQQAENSNLQEVVQENTSTKSGRLLNKGEQVIGLHGNNVLKPGSLPLKEKINPGMQNTAQARLPNPVQMPIQQQQITRQDLQGGPSALPQGGSARIAADFDTKPPLRAVKSDTQIPLEHQQQVCSPVPRILPSESSNPPQSMAQPFENQLLYGIDEEIAKVAANVVAGDARIRQKTNVHAPFDPNLICPMCMKQFRIGEIQKFRKHVLDCKGSQMVSEV